MKILALGDTHGREDWKQITAKEDFDKVVFIGDYFDTHEDISSHQQKENFKDILAYKKANIDKVILLIGNHDYHYIGPATERYSGFQEWSQTDIRELLQPAINEGLLQMCFISDGVLFSHAGVTKTWLSNNNENNENAPVDDFINLLFKYKPSSFRFTPGKNRSPYGDDIEQSPIWVRPKSLSYDAVDGFIQVVGHTTQGMLHLTTNIILIDTLGTSGEYLICETSPDTTPQFKVGKK